MHVTNLEQIIQTVILSPGFLNSNKTSGLTAPNTETNPCWHSSLIVKHINNLSEPENRQKCGKIGIHL